MSSAQNEYLVGSSTSYAALSVLLHAGACLLLAASDLAALPFLGIAAALVASAWHDLATVAWRRAPGSITSLHECDGCWRLTRVGRPAFGPAVLETFRAATPGVLLVLRDGRGARVRVVLPADALHPDALRRIRVHATAALSRATGSSA